MHSDFVIDELNDFFEIYENGPTSRCVVPFYYVPSSTSFEFPQLSHILLGRDGVNGELKSPFYDYFEKIVFDFLSSKNISHGKTMRACLNLQYSHKLPHTDPHIDSFEDHYVILIYLNDSSGDTIIYNDISDESKSGVLAYDSKLKVKEYITPEKGKIVCFDGKYYHANYLPDAGELRLVCAFNVKKSEKLSE